MAEPLAEHSDRAGDDSLGVDVDLRGAYEYFGGKTLDLGAREALISEPLAEELAAREVASPSDLDAARAEVDSLVARLASQGAPQRQEVPHGAGQGPPRPPRARRALRHR